MQQFTLDGFDGYKIFCTLWDDVEAPIGVIQLLHGMSEYAGHYDEFAKYLNKRGYIVFADDHRAHGRTETDENRGHHKGDIFAKTLKDELAFREWLKAKYELPIFLAGHSYGSFLAQAFAQAGTDVKAIALIGSGYLGSLPRLGAMALAPVKLFAGSHRLDLGGGGKKPSKDFPGETGPSLWLNSIPERRRQIVSDKYCHVTMSVNFDYCMVKNLAKITTKKALMRLNPACAIGIFSGDKDKLGKNGEGVKELCEIYRSHGVDCELHLYKDCRHEVFYDVLGEECQSDIADFFDKFVIYRQTTIYDVMDK